MNHVAAGTRLGRAPQSGRIAAFFDLDKTIIATSSAAAFSRPFYAGGLISRAGAIRSAYAHFLFFLFYHFFIN